MASFTIQETNWAHDAAGLRDIRRAVFIEEQGVPESLEWDADDVGSVHFLARALDQMPIGCARLLPDATLAEWPCCRPGEGRVWVVPCLQRCSRLQKSTVITW